MTITMRNILGGLLGGMAGILLSYYLSPWALPVGVFLGVIGGWWHQEIWAATAHGFNEGVAKAQALAAFVFTPVYRLDDWRKELWRKADGIGNPFNVFAPMLAYIATPIIWLLRRPGAMVMWTKAHPVNRAYLVRAATLPVFYMATGSIIGLLGFLLNRSTQGWDWNHDVNGIPVLFGILGLFCISVITLMVPIMFWMDGSDHDKTHRFYRTWDRYSSLGVARFYVSELWFMARAWFSVVAWLVASVAWFCGLGGAFLAIVAIMSAGIGFVKGVYQVSIRSGHLLCLGTTLITTITSATMFHGSFGDPRILWSVALLTGMASAGMTEGLRRGFVLLFKAKRPARAIALVPLGKQLRPGSRLFWRISTIAGERFTKLLPMHPQMA